MTDSTSAAGASTVTACASSAPDPARPDQLRCEWMSITGKRAPLDLRLCNPKHAGGLIVIQRKRAALG